MKISEVAQRTGLTPDTLRFYERIRLIPPPPRDAGGRRDYDAAALDWIAFLVRLNATGMKQADRIRYAALRQRGDGTAAERRRMIEAHRETVRGQIALLTETLGFLDAKIETYHRIEADHDRHAS